MIFHDIRKTIIREHPVCGSLRGKSPIERKAPTLILDHGKKLGPSDQPYPVGSQERSDSNLAWAFDEVGKTLMWELVRAHLDRGIKVEILIDHMFSEHDPH